jgi:Transposase IS116/IS110/IS902 family
VADRFPDPAVPKSIEVDLALIDAYDRLLTDLELYILKTARQHQANTRYRLQTVPGIGKILRLVWLDESHDIPRFPRVQEFVSYGRLVTCAQDSAGKRYGTSGKKIGHASLKWAVSEAAVLFLRQNAAAQKLLARVEKKHGKGKALTLLAHKLARVVYSMLTRDTVFDLDNFLNGSGSRAGEPAASLDTHGISLNDRPWNSDKALRHGTRSRTLALCPDPARLIGHPLELLDIRR